MQAAPSQVGLAPLQVTQVPPVIPQAELALPGTQVPRRQHPVRHFLSRSQVLLHSFVLGSHEASAAQSAGALQPQRPATQAWPSTLLPQSTQVSPPDPQAPASRPATQLLSAPQQPPLHG